MTRHGCPSPQASQPRPSTARATPPDAWTNRYAARDMPRIKHRRVDQVPNWTTPRLSGLHSYLDPHMRPALRRCVTPAACWRTGLRDLPLVRPMTWCHGLVPICSRSVAGPTAQESKVDGLRPGASLRPRVDQPALGTTDERAVRLGRCQRTATFVQLQQSARLGRRSCATEPRDPPARDLRLPQTTKHPQASRPQRPDFDSPHVSRTTSTTHVCRSRAPSVDRPPDNAASRRNTQNVGAMLVKRL